MARASMRLTCTPKSGIQICRGDSGGAPSSWTPRRSRGWCWRWRSCSGGRLGQTAAWANPSPRRPPPPGRPTIAAPACRIWSRRPRGTAKPMTDRRAASAAAASRAPFASAWSLLRLSAISSNGGSDEGNGKRGNRQPKMASAKKTEKKKG